jgi:hypothetical protein
LCVCSPALGACSPLPHPHCCHCCGAAEESQGVAGESIQCPGGLADYRSSCLRCPKPPWPSHWLRKRRGGAFALLLPASSGTVSLPAGNCWTEAARLGSQGAGMRMCVHKCCSFLASCSHGCNCCSTHAATAIMAATRPLPLPWSQSLPVTAIHQRRAAG